jgi:hypothetical protein
MKQEVFRQIGVRDHVLAEQADLIFAYRPFSLPDSPEPTGGVEEEITTAIRKDALGRRGCSPSVVIVHPQQDELRRRRNALNKIWPSLVRTHHLSSDLGSLEDLKKALAEVLKEAELRDREALRGRLLNVLAKSRVVVGSGGSGSALGHEGLADADAARRAFAETLLSNTVLFQCDAQAYAEKYPTLIQFRDDPQATTELGNWLAQVLRTRATEES